jgi:hypothetical protein
MQDTLLEQKKVLASVDNSVFSESFL